MVTDETSDLSKKPIHLFKNPVFQQKFRQISNSHKKKIWRSLKQIIAQERSLPWPEETIHYGFINASPSLKPAKKYSDISGLLSYYKDPHTKLFFANGDEFWTVRNLPMDITAGYLALRGASSAVG